MQNALNAVAQYGVKVARTVADDWNLFWYTPADPTLLGLLRICTGLMLVYTHAVWGLALNDFFGPTSWLSPALVRSIEAGQYTYSFWFWVPSGWMWPAYALSMLIFVCFTLGLATRVTSVLSLLTAISFTHRVPAALFGLDQINIMLTLYLAIGPSGQTLSLDRWLLRRRLGEKAPAPAPSANANLAQRLIQVHMCVIYLFAGLSKLQGPSWWSGEAMWRAFANLEYQSLDMTWLAWHPWLVNLMSHVSVVWGNRVLRFDLEAALAPGRAGRRGRYARWNWALPGNVDVRLDHAGRVRSLLAQRGGPTACVGRRASLGWCPK